MTNPIKSYMQYNFLRVAEILLILGTMFLTMQYNIKSQGELLIQLSQENKQTTMILNGLVVSVATIQTEQSNIRKDLDKLERRGDYGIWKPR